MGNLLSAVGAGQRNIDRLATPGGLRAAAEQVMVFARSYGARSVLAASPAAERLVGALLLVFDDLEGPSPEGSYAGGGVLIIDVNLASGTAVAQAARQARCAGAERVHAVVLHQLTDVTAAAADCGVDELVVLERAGSGSRTSLCAEVR